jgi:hypothetical protein
MIGAENDVWVEHDEERFKITVPRGRKEGIDYVPMVPEHTFRRFGTPLDTPPRAARELPCGVRRTIHDGGNFLKGHCKLVVEDEGEPFGGR